MAAGRRSADGARWLSPDDRYLERRRAFRSERGGRGVRIARRRTKCAERRLSGARELRAQRAVGWAERMSRQVARASQLPSPPVEGSLTRMVGLALEASGCQAAVGDVCDLLNGDGSRVEAEVVGFAGDKLFLMPTAEVHGLAPAARVVPRQRAGSVQVGPGLLGRVIDGNGVPLDGLGPIQSDDRVKLLGQTINPLARHPIDTPLDVGVR